MNSVASHASGAGAGRARRACASVLAFLVTLFLAGGAARADGTDGTLLRIFLNDGTAIVCYGEYARVADRVIFSMPVGLISGQPRLQLVNLLWSAVNWDQTLRYADAARFAHYAATRGEADFAVLTGEIAEALNEIALTTNMRRRIEIAENARHRLIDWPRAHYGFRSADVREMTALLEEAISEMRASVGADEFDLNLVATVEPPSVALLPEPTPLESIEQALAVARLSDVAAERESLLRLVVGALDEMGTRVPPDRAKALRRSALAALEAELAVDRDYIKLSRSALAAASGRAARADVHGVESVLKDVQRKDARLGRKRADQVTALLAAVNAHLDAARRLRLVRDQWALRREAYRAYRQAIAPALDDFARMRPGLDDIRTLAGPDARDLASLRERTSRATRMLARVAAPGDLANVNGMLASAAQLAGQAIEMRARAVASGDLRAAWDASAAAAGAIMLAARARSEFDTLLKPPELR
jgi:hypothetical protein